MRKQTSPPSKPDERNLKHSLIALGLLIAAGVIIFFATDLFPPATNEPLLIAAVVFGCLLAGVATVWAVFTLQFTLRNFSVNNSIKNQGAIAICFLVLVLVFYQVARSVTG